MPTPGPLEIIIVLIIVLVIFGPKRLPDLGRSLGKGMREFKDGVSGIESEPVETTPTPTKVELSPPASEPVVQTEPESERQPVS
jgi:sec-independent protein translocase protein TatA